MDTKRFKSGKTTATLVLALLLSTTVWSAETVLAAPPAAPVITTLAQSTTTNPIVLTGTAEASSTIAVTGGMGNASASTTLGGDWSVSVNLTPNTLNTLQVVAINSGAEVSATSSVAITHDSDAPIAPVIISPTSPHSTSTNPITLFGTAEASSTIMVSGGASPSTATTTDSGNWSASVALTASSTNMLSVTATDELGNVSAATTLSVTHTGTSTATTTTATSSPIITLSGLATTTIFVCNGFEEPGFSAVDSSGASITATSTGSVGSEPGTYTILYTAIDSEGHSTTVTRTVVALKCSSGSGSGGGRSNAPFITITPATSGVLPPGPPIATPPVQFMANPGGFIPPGQVLPGQVLGVSTNANVSILFASNLRIGSRGEEVTALQIRLFELGYFRGPITGYYGPITRAAVQAFQRAHGVSATGNVGPMTRAVLNS